MSDRFLEQEQYGSDEQEKAELIEQLEGYRTIITDPDDYTVEGLRKMLMEELRYLSCANCVDYESRKLCHTCTKEIGLC